MTYRYCLGICVSEEQLSAIKVVIQVEDGAVRHFNPIYLFLNFTPMYSVLISH